MIFNFKQQIMGDVVRLVLDVEDDFTLDEFALNMMNRNDLMHLVPVQLVQRDHSYYLQFDVNNMQTLQSKMSVRMGKQDVMHILNGVIEAFEEAEDYMLTEDILVLDRHYVYIDAAGQCRFLCVPCKQEEVENQIFFLRELVEQMMRCYTNEDTFLYDLINAFNRDGIKKLSDMKDLLRRLADPEMESAQMPAEQSSADIQREAAPTPMQVGSQQINMPPQKETVPEEEKKVEKKASPVSFQIPGREDAGFQIPEKKESKKSKKDAVPKADKESKIGIAGRMFGKSSAGESAAKKKIPSLPEIPSNSGVNLNADMYESYEATVMVTDEQLPQQDEDGTRMLGLSEISGILTRRKTQEQFYIGAGESVIGSGSAATCVISGNKAVSRLHAIIRLEGGKVSVKDNHSSNGTWVDGQKLNAGEAVFVGDHTMIKLADEEFDFVRN